MASPPVEVGPMRSALFAYRATISPMYVMFTARQREILEFLTCDYAICSERVYANGLCMIFNENVFDSLIMFIWMPRAVYLS